CSLWPVLPSCSPAHQFVQQRFIKILSISRKFPLTFPRKTHFLENALHDLVHGRATRPHLMEALHAHRFIVPLTPSPPPGLIRDSFGTYSGLGFHPLKITNACLHHGLSILTPAHCIYPPAPPVRQGHDRTNPPILSRFTHHVSRPPFAPSSLTSKQSQSKPPKSASPLQKQGSPHQ